MADIAKSKRSGFFYPERRVHRQQLPRRSNRLHPLESRYPVLQRCGSLRHVPDGRHRIRLPATQGMVDTLFLTRGKEGAWASIWKMKSGYWFVPSRRGRHHWCRRFVCRRCTFGLARFLPLKDAAILGSYCAAQVVRHMGACPPSSAIASVEHILNRYPGP